MNRSPAPLRAFSLIEVVLALGIISFALVSIMGVTCVGFKSFQQAISTTVETQIVQGLANQLQQTKYTSLSVAGNTNYYFNYEGGPTNSSGAVFTVAVSTPTNVALPVPAAQSPNPSANLLLVTFNITRKNSPLSTNAFQVYIANTGY